MAGGCSCSGVAAAHFGVLAMFLPLIRARDKWGAGYYGASRGSDTHKGQDFCSNLGETRELLPGDGVRAMCSGYVSKIGYPYAGNFDLRYVEITDRNGYRVRHFYVDPSVELNDDVEQGEMIGALQWIDKYPGMTPHTHVEVWKGTKHFDPLVYLSGDLP